MPRTLRALSIRLLLVATFPLATVTCVATLVVPSSAKAEELPKVVTEHMPEIVEWIYRNGALAEDPSPCKEVCATLWRDEHEALPSLPAANEYWNELGEAETKYTNLWGSMSAFGEELGEIHLGYVPLRVGWHIGGASGGKFMEVEGPRSPSSACGGYGTHFLAEGERVGSTYYTVATAPKNAWYLECGELRTIIGQSAPALNPTLPEDNCNDGGSNIAGWEKQTWHWNECFEGYDEHGEVLAPVTAEAYFQEFNFSAPEDWSGQKVEGEQAFNKGTNDQSDPGSVYVTSIMPVLLESDVALRVWLQWVLEGSGGTDPLFVSAAEEYGAGSGSTPHKPKCMEGKPVNCATGNQVETQTDLTVGGREPGLQLTRTYNSQLAASGASSGPFGYGWTGSYSEHVEYNSQLDEAVVYQADGSQLRFFWGSSEWVPMGPLVQAKLAREGSGWAYTLPNQTVQHFNSSGQLTSEADRNGNTITIGYNGEGRIETVSDAAGRKLTYTYNSVHDVESVKDPMGHTVKYTYEGGNLASITLPGETSANWKFKYNTEHELTEETDGRGYTTKTEYNSSHRVTKQTEPLERIRTWEYSTTPSSTQTTIVEPNGSTTVENFNAAGLPVSITRASGTSLAATTTHAYNRYADLIATTNPNGNITRFGYDRAGDRTSETDPEGDTTEWVYNSTHDVIETRLPDGAVTTIVREGHGNPESITRSGAGVTSETTKYKYDSHGDLESVTNPLEHTTKYEYDTYGDKTAEIDPESNKRTWEYNEDSQPTAMVSPRGHASGAEPSKFTTKYERDQQGRVVKVTDPLAHTTKYTYDAAGNLETVTDGNSHKTTYKHDADDELTKTEEPNGTATETGYDKAGQVTSQTDGLTHVTKYVRNALEEVTEVVDPRERKTTKEYDKAGNLTKITDAEGRTTTIAYTPDNRASEVTYSDGHTHSVKYEYNGDGKVTHMADGTGETTYTYDTFDRLKESKNGQGETSAYEYNTENLPVKITYPNSKAITRTYDKDGRLESVKDWSEHTTKFTYDQDSDLTKTTFPANEDRYTYNDADQQSEVKMLKGSETLASLAYTRDGDNQVKTVTSKSFPGEEKPEYTYDSNNRLTKGAGVSYEYNKANSPTKIGSGSYGYNAADELETGPSVTYTFNEVGERIKSTPTTGSATVYGYDQAGNLTSVERGTELNDSYAYSGSHLRASQTISGTTTYLAWDEAEELPLLLSDGTNSYIYGPGNVPVEQINNSTSAVLYLHHDQQGSTRLLTSATGAKEATFTYGPYGTLTGSTGTAATPLGYDSQYTSSDTGLIYLRARVYDPATAQFLSVDPLQLITRASYSYVGDNPLNQRDPSGLFTVGICVSGEVALGIRVGVGVCGQVSSSGEAGLTGTVNGGAASGAGASAGIGIQSSTAEHIAELGGPFGHIGGSIHVGGGVSTDTFYGGDNGCGGQVVGGEISLGVGGGADQYGAISETETVAAGL
jgi:RHS repeat-associated protein